MIRVLFTLAIVALVVVACSSPAPDAAPAQQSPSPAPRAQAAQGELMPADIQMNERSAFGEITLAKVGSVCQVVAAYNSVHANHGQLVMWTVENQCGTEQSLELTDFREKFSGTSVFPFEPGAQASCTAPASGSRRCHIIMRVLDEDPNRQPGSRLNKVYTYGFARKGGDPELVIEWP